MYRWFYISKNMTSLSTFIVNTSIDFQKISVNSKKEDANNAGKFKMA